MEPMILLKSFEHYSRRLKCKMRLVRHLASVGRCCEDESKGGHVWTCEQFNLPLGLPTVKLLPGHITLEFVVQGVHPGPSISEYVLTGKKISEASVQHRYEYTLDVITLGINTGTKVYKAEHRWDFLGLQGHGDYQNSEEDFTLRGLRDGRVYFDLGCSGQFKEIIGDFIFDEKTQLQLPEGLRYLEGYSKLSFVGMVQSRARSIGPIGSQAPVDYSNFEREICVSVCTTNINWLCRSIIFLEQVIVLIGLLKQGKHQNEDIEKIWKETIGYLTKRTIWIFENLLLPIKQFLAETISVDQNICTLAELNQVTEAIETYISMFIGENAVSFEVANDEIGRGKQNWLKVRLGMPLVKKVISLLSLSGSTYKIIDKLRPTLHWIVRENNANVSREWKQHEALKIFSCIAESLTVEHDHLKPAISFLGRPLTIVRDGQDFVYLGQHQEYWVGVRFGGLEYGKIGSVEPEKTIAIDGEIECILGPRDMLYILAAKYTKGPTIECNLTVYLINLYDLSKGRPLELNKIHEAQYNSSKAFIQSVGKGYIYIAIRDEVSKGNSILILLHNTLSTAEALFISSTDSKEILTHFFESLTKPKEDQDPTKNLSLDLAQKPIPTAGTHLASTAQAFRSRSKQSSFLTQSTIVVKRRVFHAIANSSSRYIACYEVIKGSPDASVKKYPVAAIAKGIEVNRLFSFRDKYVLATGGGSGELFKLSRSCLKTLGPVSIPSGVKKPLQLLNRDVLGLNASLSANGIIIIHYLDLKD